MMKPFEITERQHRLVRFMSDADTEVEAVDLTQGLYRVTESRDGRLVREVIHAGIGAQPETIYRVFRQSVEYDVDKARAEVQREAAARKPFEDTSLFPGVLLFKTDQRSVVIAAHVADEEWTVMETDERMVVSACSLTAPKDATPEQLWQALEQHKGEQQQ